jgi:release factor glutamine methyltransferase
MGSTVTHLPKYIAEQAVILEKAGVESAAAEIEWILCHVLNLDRLNLYLYGANLLNDENRKRVDEIVARRATRYPLQYILEESWFYGRRFFVSPAVMAPTPETELLCETAVKFIGQSGILTPGILDVGVGSGVIAVTMALEAPTAHVVALDISPDALVVARRNALEHQAQFRIEFRQSDLFASIRDNERFDLILANPPYIAEPDYAGLDPEVLADPKIAMTAGADGLDIIRRIVKQAPDHLAAGGRIIFEIGFNQAEKVARLTEVDARYESIDILRDLNDIDRIVILSCRSN